MDISKLYNLPHLTFKGIFLEEKSNSEYLQHTNLVIVGLKNKILCLICKIPNHVSVKDEVLRLKIVLYTWIKGL
jgi:hypothetical protein